MKKQQSFGLEEILEKKDTAPKNPRPKPQMKDDDLPGGSADDDFQFANFKPKDNFGLDNPSKTKPIQVPMKKLVKEKEEERELPQGVPVFPVVQPKQEEVKTNPTAKPPVADDGFTIEETRAQKKERKI